MNIKSKLMPVLKHKVIMPIVTIVALLFVVGFIALEVTKAEVEFTHNNETEVVVTRAETVDALLTELEIEVTEDDYLSHELDAPIEKDMALEYKKAQEVIVTDGETSESYMTTEDTVAEFLQEVNVAVGEHDALTPSKQTDIEAGLEIELDRAVEVTLTDGTNEAETLYTTVDTVEELLAAEDITLDELDRVEPSETKALTDQTTVAITRVEEVTDIVEEDVQYSTVRRNDGSISKGKEQVIESGSTGLVEKHYKVVIENGEEVSRELIEENVKKEAESRVVAVGTKVAQPTVSRGSSSAPAGGTTISMNATAYNWNCATCDGRGRTATGYNVKANPDGVVAVDPRVIPLGTRVYVEGYGYAVARDTGGAIKGNKIDLHMRSIAEAKRFGRRQIKVTILE
ncbi:uncharacterized protein YabE (DUF348 family) [Streptohalobacillus salinus]|uniref:Uncharacterized protein YabE (DUF348 family) n=1 Tax=Streptohalobacillus salinus TaxID=621096 RepID=A0A2V3W2F4_9BACI|nr:G5 and 3D domain-containing protein [Streptohalobacillus salinus]PXW88477.1 uncharacterized protein YabE (DUF348 family) [Streptohalobacillus salinus]